MPAASPAAGRRRAPDARRGLLLAAFAALAACVPGDPPAPDAARPPPGVAPADHGARLLAEGRPEPAARAFRRALAQDGPSLPVLLGLGAAARAQGQGAEAARLFARAVADHPDSAAARNALGAALYDAGRPSEAAEQFRAAEALLRAADRPIPPELALNLGLAARAAARAPLFAPAPPIRPEPAA